MKRVSNSGLSCALIAICVLATSGDASADEPSVGTASENVPADAAAEEARSRARRGVELYDEGDYGLALLELQRAYSLHPTYKLLFNIAQVHYQMKEYAKARATFERYLAEGSAEISAERRAEVERELALLAKRVATLTVRVNVAGASVTINDRLVGQSPLQPTVVDAGTLRVQAARPGFVTSTREVSLAGGDQTTVDIELTRPEVVVTHDRMSGLAIGGWITTAVLGAGAIGFGIAANAVASNYDTKLDNPISGSAADAAADLEHQRTVGTNLAITTDILIGATAVAAGVSLYLTLRDPKPASPRVSVQGRGLTFVAGF